MGMVTEIVLRQHDIVLCQELGVDMRRWTHKIDQIVYSTI